MANAYPQLPLDEALKQYTTINTHEGLFQYNRLPFGVSSASAIFQRAMETFLQGYTHTCVYFDDIVVTGRTTEEHLKNLGAVLEKLEAAGLKLNRNKCVFMAPYL